MPFDHKNGTIESSSSLAHREGGAANINGKAATMELT
jgi:hypothetical protein